MILEDEVVGFLRLESSKAGYSEITRIRIKNPYYNANLPEEATNKKYFEITDSNIIRTHTHSTFQDIYTIQPDLNNTQNALEDYINSDSDTEPLAELNRRKISKQD
jgi:hypothetical protein